MINFSFIFIYSHSSLIIEVIPSLFSYIINRQKWIYFLEFIVHYYFIIICFHYYLLIIYLYVIINYHYI